MNRTMIAVIVLAGSVFLITCSGQPVATQVAPPVAPPEESPAPHSGEGGVPQYAADPGWQKVPAKYRLGRVSSVAIDANNHVWMLHRPHTLPESEKAMAAPAVIEFDNDGNFIQGWGGKDGEGYQWPLDEHGIHVDAKGNVWVIGDDPRDGQILKFTNAGKLLLQIGGRDKTVKHGQGGNSNNPETLGEATGLRVHAPTNELFVTDGYVNRRLIVFDADTGKYKRHWGAYGNKPIDLGPRAGVKEAVHIKFFPLDPWRSYAENLQQFDNPHDVGVSNDGLVYVADRGNKRIQVFTIDGTYIKQQFVGVDNVKYLQKTANCPAPPCHQPDIQSRSVAFSPDPQQKFLYVAGLPDVYILNRKTMEVLGSFATGEAEAHPPNHHIAVDGNGHTYTAQTTITGTEGSGQLLRFVFKGLSPRKATN